MLGLFSSSSLAGVDVLDAGVGMSVAGVGMVGNDLHAHMLNAQAVAHAAAHAAHQHQQHQIPQQTSEYSFISTINNLIYLDIYKTTFNANKIQFIILY